MLKRPASITVLVCAVLGAGPGFAYEDVSGVIQKIDVPARQLVLDGERTYPVARGIDLAKYRIGDKVVLRTDDEFGKKDLVTKIVKGDYIRPPQPKQSSRSRSIP